MTTGLLSLPAVHLDPGWQQIAYVALWGGAAVIPDWDHHSASPTIMWGPISGLLTAPLRQLPGGHRWATHDLVLAPLAGGAITWALINLTVGITALAADIATYLHAPWWLLACIPFAIGILPLAMLIGLVLKMTVLPHGAAAPNLLLSIAAAWWFTHHPAPHLAALLPLIVAGAMAVHIIGDGLTVELVPVPIAWIFTRARIGLPLFEVGGSVERLLVAPVLGVLICWLTWRHLPMEIQQDLLGLVHRVDAARHEAGHR